MSRLFFALWPDDATRTQIKSVVATFPEGTGRKVIPANFHITLEFLGEVSDQDRDALINCVSKIHCNSFDLELTQTGLWRKPQILWLGTNYSPPPLLDLVESIRQCVRLQDLIPDNREYKPHVTVARKARKKIQITEPFIISWHVDRFVLAESTTHATGVEYQVINSWPLN